MKKFALMMVAMLAIGLVARADDDRVITFQQLPAPAQAFHKQHFAGKVPLTITVDRDDYTIYYESGEKVEFDKKGNWKDIDCRVSAVPPALVPEQIKAHLRGTFPGTTVIKLDKNRRGWEVKINNGMEIEYSRSFQVIDMDD